MRAMKPSDADRPLDEADIAELQEHLEALPAPLEPLDVSALDGYLCGVLLQPQPVPDAQWLARVHDVEGRALAEGVDTQRLDESVRRRFATLRTEGNQATVALTKYFWGGNCSSYRPVSAAVRVRSSTWRMSGQRLRSSWTVCSMSSPSAPAGDTHQSAIIISPSVKQKPFCSK